MVKKDIEAARVAAELAIAITRLRARLRLESTASEWSWPQLLTLARIIKEGPITASALAQAEHVQPQSMAETLASLKSSGLVASSQDPNDGRKTLISATPEGLQLSDSVNAVRRAWLTRAITAVVSPDERENLLNAIDVLNRLADCDLLSEDSAA